MAYVDVRLGLDSAGPHLALALWSPQHGVLAQRAPRVERTHAARIVGELDALFDEAAVDRTDLSGVTVGLGPGSYTGVRVGVAAARGLTHALDLPLGGVDSLALIAWAQLAPGETGVAVLDARRGNVYAGIYRRSDHDLVTLHPPSKRPRENVRAEFASARWLEDGVPSAVWAAMRPTARHDIVPVYL